MSGNPGSVERPGNADSGEARRRPQQASALKHLHIVYSADGPHGSFRDRAYPDKARGMLDRTVQGQIGRMLRHVFAHVADEAVPERFVKLLEALEAKEKQS